VTTPRASALLVLIASFAIACATGSNGADGDAGGGGGPVDAGTGAPLDAGTTMKPMPRPDAAPISDVELTQSTSRTIEPFTGGACYATIAGIPVATYGTSYYRAFDLAAEGLPDGFLVDGLSFAVDAASQQRVDVFVYKLAGPFDLAGTSELARTSIDLPDLSFGPAQMIDVPLSATVPAGSSLVVEVLAEQFGTLFVAGSNSAPETGPTYVRSPDCGVASPTPVDDVIDVFEAPIHWVLTVRGRRP
jgi:hypothetical protein